MQAHALCLSFGYEQDLWTLLHALQLRSNIFIPLCDGVDHIVLQAPFIGQEAHSPFLVLREFELNVTTEMFNECGQ